MTDSKISKKTGSLSRRILIIVILLLVIPLFFHSIFLYRQEYQLTLGEWMEDLQVVAKERAHLIKETIRLDEQILEARSCESKATSTVSVSSDAIVIEKEGDKILIPFTDIGKEIPFTHPVRIALIEENGKLIWENTSWKDENLLRYREPLPETNLVLELNLDKKDIEGLHLDTYIFRFASLLFFVGFLGGMAVYFFTRRIAKPLNDLVHTMGRVSEGASHARYTPDRMGFEVNELGLRFNQTLDSLLHHREEAEKQRLLREKLAEELRIGHEIQSNLSPIHIPGMAGLDIATGYFAAKEVNGDFYDLFEMEDGRLLLAVCDTAGKGISACLFSLGLRSMIRSLATATRNLSELICRVNDLYYADAHESSMFSTLWLGIYDPKKSLLTYCSQGHPPAVLLRNQEMKELWTDGIALGAQKFDMVTTKEITLRPDDLFFLYSDGLIEAHNEQDELFGKKRLYNLISQKQKKSPQEIKDFLMRVVGEYAQNASQHDDITFIICRIL